MRRRRSRGQSLVEFALVLPLILLLFMGVFDFGRAIFAYNSAASAAREGMRKAIVDQNPAAIEAEARAATSGMNPSEITVTYTDCAPPPTVLGCLGSVTVAYQWKAITPVIGSFIGPINLSATTTMPIERVYVSATP